MRGVIEDSRESRNAARIVVHKHSCDNLTREAANSEWRGANRENRKSPLSTRYSRFARRAIPIGLKRANGEERIGQSYRRPSRYSLLTVRHSPVFSRTG